ncbi:MAG: cof family hydrolase [Spirochaetes bacterium]|nr:MAG: cof family hydrolase [Spirochaetota bacterium]
MNATELRAQGSNIDFIALDMDGTILDSTYTISPRVVETIQRCRQMGKKVIISTGRVYSSVLRNTKALGRVDGYVCSNGADVYDGEGNPICRLHMGEALSRRLVAISRRFPSHFHAFIGDSWFYEAERSYTDFYIKRSGLQGGKVDFESYPSLEFTKCIFLDDPEKLAPIAAAMEQELKEEAEYMFSAPFMLEVVIKGVDKETGLERYLAMVGGSLERTLAFGDADNDEAMIKAAGIGVAMGNADEDLKAKADFVAPSVDDDGVAAVLGSMFGITQTGVYH